MTTITPVALSAFSYAADQPGVPLVVLHGLFGQARNWASHAKTLSDERPVHCLDLRNHGRSPWSDVMDYPAMAADVAAFIESIDRGPAVVMGHSMGGKAAMMLALTRPDLVKRLIIVDVAPRAYRHTMLHYAEAMLSAPLGPETTRGDVDKHLASVASEAPIRAFLGQNLRPGPNGLHWQINLPVLAREMVTISGWPVPAPDAHYDGPTLFLRGGDSDYMRPDLDGAEVKRLFPRSLNIAIKGTGHWVHADKPAEFTQSVQAFLAHEVAPGVPT